MPAWSLRDDGIQLIVRVTPRGGRDGLAAGTGDHLRARLAAAPVDGAANDALVALVARHFAIARGAVRIVAGQTARVKRLHLTGTPATLAQIARALYGDAP